MIGFDIDGVLANFTEGFYRHFNQPYKVIHKWNDPFILERFSIIKEDPSFWLGLDPYDVTIDKVDVYITHRFIPSSVTEEWLKKHEFPKAPVITLMKNENKGLICKDIGVTKYIDDKGENIRNVIKQGIKGFLLHRPWNSRYKLPRVYTINEFYES